MNQEEYIITQDGDGHWYVIPTEKEIHWNKINELDSEIIDLPGYAKQIGGSPTLVKFKNYRIE